MQSLATYCLSHTAISWAAAEHFLDSCVASVENWLSSKGERTEGKVWLNYGGRSADLHVANYPSSKGVMREWELTEPLKDRADGEFRTTLQLAQKGEVVHLYLSLKAGYRSTTIAPELPVAVKPPRVLFDLAKLPQAHWKFGAMPVGLKPLVFGPEHADVLIDWLGHTDRPMPVVALSEYEGEILHPHPTWQGLVVERLFGMALVVRFTERLSWELTRKLGKIWSCYHGAVRIYWPGLTFDGDPFRHDLMTADGIMSHFRTSDRATAADRLLNYLFERFRLLSTFSVRCPLEFSELRRASGAERVTELRRQVTAKRDATKVVADLAGRNRQLEKLLASSEKSAEALLNENDDLVKQIEELEAKLTDTSNELAQLRYQHASGQRPAEVKTPPVQHRPQPQTITEAIDRARKEFAEELIFGGHVDCEAGRLLAEAGPPSWVFTHLEWLSKLSKALQTALRDTGKASLGIPHCDWLTKEGVIASPEKGRTMEVGAAARTWDFGKGNGTKFTFNNHTKPNDAAPHNQCVRIYFQWCDDRKKIVIGSVGRHPDH